MMRIFMNSSRWRCKASVACCAAVLVPTNFTPHCCTANQIAWASVASVLLPLTKERTIFACNSRTVCPSLLKFTGPVVRTTTGLYRNQARRRVVGKVLQHLGALDLHVNNFTDTYKSFYLFGPMFPTLKSGKV
jgi:hypothetical protein